MKYYCMLTISFNNDQKDQVSIYTFDNKDAAVASYHTSLGGWMKKEETQHILCLVVSDDGWVIKNEAWDRPTEE